MRKKLGFILFIAYALSVLCGCDPITLHKVTSTIFDGVPSLPPPDQFCQEYQVTKVEDEKKKENLKLASNTAGTGSSHLPYREKRCNDCHDKSQDSGLIKPKAQLCFVCHPNIIKGSVAHGPAAVGSCLECHEPHSSSYPALMKAEKGKLCAGCHQEDRLAQAMHQKVSTNGMFCMDCHDPHGGTSAYFLR